MANFLLSDNSYEMRLKRKIRNWKWRSLHLDSLLIIYLLILGGIGLFILYSASEENMVMVAKQAARLLFAFGLMIICAQIPPRRYYELAPWLYFGGLFLLVLVLIIGKVDQGAKRWLNLGFIHLQPSEIMKLALPLMLAWFLDDKTLPLTLKNLLICFAIMLFPALLIAKQPDLGTATVITISACIVLLLAGISWRYIISCFLLLISGAPILWHFMRDYQRQRVLTFINPEHDPLGKGYHIIQSKIAVGSGGFLGKGWLHGTQSHLSFLPTHTTDFIFAVIGEEFGFIGSLLIIILCLLIFMRCLYMSTQAQDTFTRLISGTISAIFFFSGFVNIGMVIGILPVVGVPLPLISYGGSSLVMTFIGFGIIMSIHTHKKLWSG